jgi:hypothetical protein
MPDTIPRGFRLLPASVYLHTDGRMVITAEPDNVWPGYEDADGDHPHNCDAAGCRWEHVVARCRVEPAPREPTEEGGRE